MSAVNNLLDKYRETCSLPSDSAVADSLHIKRQAVHQWRKGVSWPSEDHVLEMTKAMQEPAERWFIAISADRASPAARKVWLKLAQVAASLLLVVTAAGPQRVEAQENFGGGHAIDRSGTSIHYAQ
ncbi:hypothetical protein ISP17_13420 [Dyella ginsengisoli]|uniref:XRE family transcriptional regulator n=1 Tax=Dyella ginsengisoli TaxID=363848 RepID=A0ABW8JZ54_9GAMM